MFSVLRAGRALGDGFPSFLCDWLGERGTEKKREEEGRKNKCESQRRGIKQTHPRERETERERESFKETEGSVAPFLSSLQRPEEPPARASLQDSCSDEERGRGFELRVHEYKAASVRSTRHAHQSVQGRLALC